MNIEQAIEIINDQVDKTKYEAMINTASVITKLLEEYEIIPIIVGGLSVEIYTENDYTTRDIDFVSERHDLVENILLQLRFKKHGKVYYHDLIEVSVEIPSNHLAGSYEKVVKASITDDRYVYIISIEDIILDRLRAYTHWTSAQDGEWGFELLARNSDEVDKVYLYNHIEHPNEKVNLDEWYDILERESNSEIEVAAAEEN